MDIQIQISEQTLDERQRWAQIFPELMPSEDATNADPAE